MRHYVAKGLALLLSGGVASNAWSIGTANIGNEVLSARAAGQGYVGVAGQSNDPTVVWANPGAVTSLPGTQMTFGGTLERLAGSYETNAGVTHKERVTTVGVPNFSMTHRTDDGLLGFGFTVQSVYGLETHWPGNSPLRYIATNSRLATVTVSPVIAVQLTPTFSIGAGPDITKAMNAQLDRAIAPDAINAALQSPTAGSADGVSSLRGKGSAWGGHAGFVYKPTEKHAFGVTYHAPVTLTLDGSETLTGLTGTGAAVFGGSSYATGASVDLTLPENIQIGYSYKPTPKWMLEADAAWYHMSGISDFNVHFKETNAYRLAVLNQGNPSLFRERDSWSFATGANYILNDRWQYRAGFWYEPWSLPETNFNPAFLDLSRYGITAGCGVQVTSNVSLDAAYSAIFTHNRTISNDLGTRLAGFSQADIDGTYKNFAHLVALNVNYKWGK